MSQQTQADGGTYRFACSVTSGVVTQTTVTDPNGKPQTTRFNGRGYGLEQTDGQGQATQSRRDPATNQVLASVDSLGRTTQFEYDANGNVTKITDPTNQATLFEYEPMFNLVPKITETVRGLSFGLGGHGLNHLSC